MAASVTVEVKGLKELQDRLHNLADDIQKKVIFSAALAGATVIRKRAIANARGKGLIDTGALLKNIANKREKTPLGKAQYNVGVRHGQQRKADARARKAGVSAPKTDDPYYWWYLEFGTAKMSAKPFLAPAFDAGKNEALDAMVDKLKQRLDKAGA